MLKSFQYRLYPSQAQQRLLEQTLETCRRWYNTCLAERKEAWENEKRHKPHGTMLDNENTGGNQQMRMIS